MRTGLFIPMNFTQAKLNQTLTLESGYTFGQFEVGYHTWGQLNALKDNVIWVCHAFTANSNVEEWWPGMVGEGKLFDPTIHYIICVNLPGSCYGTTGPLSVNPATGQPYYHSFPFFTVRDVVKVYQILANQLGIKSIYMLIGGSLGGQQALEWAVQAPGFVKNLIAIATNATHSAWGIAFNEAQRMAIEADETWKLNTPDAGRAGMVAARSVAMLSYRNYQTYQATQIDDDANKTDRFKAASYQQYQGDKLARRFNAFSYYSLSKTMDSHNIGRGRESIVSALQTIEAHTLVLGIRSDYLFPVSEQKFLARHIPEAVYAEIDSHYGHDGFLVETEKLTICVREFLRKQERINRMCANLQPNNA